MGRIYEPTPEQEGAWREWVASRPDAVRAIAERFEPWSLFRLKGSGHRVTIYSLQESDPVTLTVNVSGQFNAVMFERQVFGISPDDLEPCDPPAQDEPVGVVLTEREDVLRYIDSVRDEERGDSPARN